MATKIQKLLEELDTSSSSGRGRGKFERLIATYPHTDPSWSTKITKVLLRNEWPERAGKPDTDIDLLAQGRETGTARLCTQITDGGLKKKTTVISCMTSYWGTRHSECHNTSRIAATDLLTRPVRRWLVIDVDSDGGA